MAKLPYIESIEQWDRLLADKTDERDLVVFKVSSVCGMSFMADRQVEAWLNDLTGPLEVDFFKVDVHSGRPVSDRIEEHFGIRHESPQILWIGADNDVRWHGSHRAIARATLDDLYAGRPGG